MGTYVGGDANGGNVTNLTTVDWPAGVQSGDVALFAWTHSSTTTEATPPSGFTLYDTDTDGACVNSLYVKVCDGTETGALSVSTDLTTRQTAALGVFRGYSGINAQTSALHTTAASTSHNPPAVTPTVADAAIVIVTAERVTTGSTSATAPAGFQTRQQFGTGGTGGSFTWLGSDDLVTSRTAGVAVDPASVVHGVAAADAVMRTIALEPTSTAVDLVVADSAHEHTSDSPGLTQVHVLAPDGTDDAHTADSPALTQVHELAPADTANAHASDSPALTQLHLLAPVDSAHAHATDASAITQVHLLAPADSTHDNAADAAALTQVHQLAPPADSFHGNTATSPTLGGGATLTVADTANAHAAESPALTQVHVLAPADSVHAHGTDLAALAQVHMLAVLDTLNTHTSTTSSLAGTQATPPERISTAGADPRASTALSEPRTSTAARQPRTSTSTAQSRTSS